MAEVKCSEELSNKAAECFYTESIICLRTFCLVSLHKVCKQLKTKLKSLWESMNCSVKLFESNSRWQQWRTKDYKWSSEGLISNETLLPHHSSAQSPWAYMTLFLIIFAMKAFSDSIKRVKKRESLLRTRAVTDPHRNLNTLQRILF